MRKIKEIQLKDITKIYKKGKVGLRDLNLKLSLYSGVSNSTTSSDAVNNLSIVGILGRNGAGKTTLLRILAGILKPTKGKIFVNGEPLDKIKRWYKEKLGYLPQEFGVYPELTGFEFLDLIGTLYGIRSKKARKERIDRIDEILNLKELLPYRLFTFSHGMKQKIGIAQALLNEPEILILDEPTAGLDPIERAEFFKIIKKLSKNALVLFSTHILPDIQEVCNHVITLDKGELLYFDRIDKLTTGTSSLEQAYISLLSK